MKYPAQLTFDEILPELNSFDSIIDVRSPSEFAEDHIPGAINCPVLDDEERIRIGTMYKQIGSFEAKKYGAALVAKNIARHIENTLISHPKNWKPLVYCWRGGNRSGAMAHILAKIGWPVVQLSGGYKSYRQHVNTDFPQLCHGVKWRVVCGMTGSGKSHLLKTLASMGVQVLDLEQLAAHRGSVLGTLPDEAQPSQKMFESRLWNSLRSMDRDRPVFVEAESKKVGNVRIPEAIMDGMRMSPCLDLELPTPMRVELLMRDYEHFVDSPDALTHQLDCLIKIHGYSTIDRWKNMARTGEMRTLVSELLEKHYDPAYLKSIHRNFLHSKTAMDLHQTGITGEDFERTAHSILERLLHESASSTILCPS